MELIEKLKKVSTGLGRLGQIAEQNTINEAIALMEKHAEQMKKHAIEFKTYIDDVEQFSLRTLSDEERYNEYQAFLNREEK